MNFLYSFLNFLQPGILFPALAPFKPMLLISVLAGAAAFTHADPQLRVGYFRHPAFIWLCIFMLIQVISVYYSGIRSIIEELLFWVVYPLFVAVSLLLIRDAASLRRYVVGMMCGGGFIVGYGLYQAIYHADELAGGRAGAYGMYENHNDYTFMIIMLLPYAYMLTHFYRSVLARLLLWALVAGCAAGVFLSLSRGGILALVLECGLLLWLSMKGAKRWIAVAVLCAVGSAAVVYQFAAREENQAGQYTEADAKNSRYELWSAAWNMVLAHPVMGIGSRRFSEYSHDYGEISHDNRGKVAHNTLVEIVADTGLLGLSAFLLMLRGLWRATKVELRTESLSRDGIELLQVATFVGLIAILMRSMLDAKAHDWSFYFFVVVGISASTLLARVTLPEQPAAAAEAAPRTIPPRRPRAFEGGSQRPAIYRRNH